MVQVSKRADKQQHDDQRATQQSHKRMTKDEQSLAVTYNTEGRLADLGSSLGVVITHPWGPLGGNFQNNVVRAVAVYFQQIGITTLRFDFCGSQLGFGTTQVDQMKEICQKLLQGEGCTRPPPRKLLLVGYSYGSLISTSASADLADVVVGTISIAPPFGVQYWLLLFQSSYHTQRAASLPEMPRFFVIGSKDNFTDVKTFNTTVERDFSATRVKSAIVIPEADHFFHRQEGAVTELMGDWLQKTIGLENLDQLASYYERA